MRVVGSDTRTMAHGVHERNGLSTQRKSELYRNVDIVPSYPKGRKSAAYSAGFLHTVQCQLVIDSVGGVLRSMPIVL